MSELVVLGSGTGVPWEGRGAPGYLLRAEGVNLLLDCGPGTIRSAARWGADPGRVDGVLLTHFHPDHTLGVPELLFALGNARFAGRSPLLLAGPRGLRELLDHWRGGPQGRWLSPRGVSVRVREIAPGEHEILGFRVRAVAVRHARESLAYSVRGPGSDAALAYTGDTGPCAGAVEAARGAEILLAECSFPDGWEGKDHLTPSSVGRIAARARPRRLLLTHFYPEVEEEPVEEIVARFFAGPVERVRDGARYPLGGRGPAAPGG